MKQARARRGAPDSCNRHAWRGYSVDCLCSRAHGHSCVPGFDAFQDNPWPVLYRRLGRRYPGSRFILTVRDPQEWIASAVRYFGAGSTPVREWTYGAGSPVGNEQLYLRRYQRHNEEVLAWFAVRDDLLVMDIARGDGWAALCGFLGCDAPALPFPHENRSAGGR